MANLDSYPTLKQKVAAFFKKLDKDGDGEVTEAEAEVHWSGNFSKINKSAMFNEVDTDKDGKITLTELEGFFANVIASGYSVENLEEELDDMMNAESWVDFDDGRTTGMNK